MSSHHQILCILVVHICTDISPRCDKGGEVAVVWVEGNAVLFVPAVEDRLLGVARYNSCLVKRALHVVGFKCGMAVQCLEVPCATEFIVVFWCRLQCSDTT